MREGSIAYQMRAGIRQAAGAGIAQSLDRNGSPFLVVHVGVRSTFLDATRTSRG